MSENKSIQRHIIVKFRLKTNILQMRKREREDSSCTIDNQKDWLRKVVYSASKMKVELDEARLTNS